MRILSKLRNSFSGGFYSLNNLDKKMLKYINYKNGYYVEIGANDGIVQSNTLYFEKKLNWSGLLIEPIKHNFEKLRINRSSRNSFEESACVSFTHLDKDVNMIYSNLMSTVLNPKNEISDPNFHAKIGEKFLNKESIYQLQVPATPLNNILKKHHTPKRIDFFSLDVEGFEYEVLNGIDHVEYRFNYILVESRNINKMQKFLSSNSYKMIDQLSHHDYLFTDLLKY